MDTITNRRMMRVNEAARFLGLSISFLNKLRCSGGGPRFIKIGRAVLYDPSDLDSWLLSRRRASTSEGESS